MCIYPGLIRLMILVSVIGATGCGGPTPADAAQPLPVDLDYHPVDDCSEVRDHAELMVTPDTALDVTVTLHFASDQTFGRPPTTIEKEYRMGPPINAGGSGMAELIPISVPGWLVVEVAATSGKGKASLSGRIIPNCPSGRPGSGSRL